MMISLFDRVENIVGKGENASYLLFPDFFLQPPSSGSLKVRNVWLTFFPTYTHFNTLKKKALGKLAISPFSTMFSMQPVS